MTSRLLLRLTVALAFVVVVAGAWVRLSDAGLGCPDWPGCYGQWLGVPAHAADAGKAWKEMLHRYLAGSLGLAILAVSLAAWRRRPSPWLPAFLLGLLALQAALGRWTVTLLLKPLVVTAHLLGGMAILALLVCLERAAASGRLPRTSPPAALRALGAAALALLAVQIALGGWVSSNYAALACPDFPTCRGEWLPAADFAAAFTLHRPLGLGADGEALPAAALTAIQWSHRAGALALAIVVALLAGALRRLPGGGRAAALLLALLALQVGLGAANVLFARPLPFAVAHNAVAALLLAAVAAINHRLWRAADVSFRLRPAAPGTASTPRSPPSPPASRQSR